MKNSVPQEDTPVMTLIETNTIKISFVPEFGPQLSETGSVSANQIIVVNSATYFASTVLYY